MNLKTSMHFLIQAFPHSSIHTFPHNILIPMHSSETWLLIKNNIGIQLKKITFGTERLYKPSLFYIRNQYTRLFFRKGSFMGLMWRTFVLCVTAGKCIFEKRPIFLNIAHDFCPKHWSTALKKCKLLNKRGQMDIFFILFPNWIENEIINIKG